MLLALLLVFFLAYLLGSIPFGIIIVRLLKGIDIRDYGSRNPGATNVYRVAGFKIAVIVLLLDSLKGALAVMSAMPLFSIFEVSLPPLWLPLTAGLFAVVGHMWTLFAGFKGGKGVGTGLGIFLALNPVSTLISLGIWILTVSISKYVSLGSVLAALTLFVLTLFQFFSQKIDGYLLGMTSIIVFLVILSHRPNIYRLIHGQENKIGQRIAT